MSTGQIEVNKGPLVYEQSTLNVGVLADTHLPYRMQQLPTRVLSIFAGADLILHAGDVDHTEHLAGLASVAPLYAVRGNLHFTDLSHGGMDLPVELRMKLAGYSVVVNHGGWPGFWSLAGDWFMDKILDRERKRANPRLARRLQTMYPQANVAIFGHTHRPYQAWQHGIFFLNPGAVCDNRHRRPSVAKLTLQPDLIQAEIIPLDG